MNKKIWKRLRSAGLALVLLTAAGWANYGVSRQTQGAGLSQTEDGYQESARENIAGGEPQKVSESAPGGGPGDELQSVPEEGPGDELQSASGGGPGDELQGAPEEGPGDELQSASGGGPGDELQSAPEEGPRDEFQDVPADEPDDEHGDTPEGEPGGESGDTADDGQDSGFQSSPGDGSDSAGGDGGEPLQGTADFTLTVKAESDVLKAGQMEFYRIELTNTGTQPFENITLKSVLSCPKVAVSWEPGENLETDGATVRVSSLEPEESRILYLEAQLTETQSGNLRNTVTAAGIPVPEPDTDNSQEPQTPEADGLPIIREASVETPVQPLTADFTVEKIADRSIAVPGDTIIYQICIRNTGERTLHSVVGTERFQDADITARFLEQEGVILNGDGTKAMIGQIAPGSGVALQAAVTLPQNTVDRELLNEVTVVTAETEEEIVSSQAAVQVEASQPVPVPETLYFGGAGPVSLARKASAPPKTGDSSGGGFFALLMAAAFLFLGKVIRFVLKKWKM